MKKTDIAMIILIATISVFLAFFAARSVLGDINRSAKVKTVDKIEADIQEPDPMVFNKDAINPTVQVQINSSQKE